MTRGRASAPHDAPHDWEGAQRHLGLITLMAQRVAGRWGLRYLDLDDFIQVGLVAVARALPHFDPSKGMVSTWVAAHARGSMLSLAKTTMPLRVPLNAFESKKDAARALVARASKPPIGLDTDDPIEIAELVPSDPTIASEEREERESLHRAIDDLPPRWRRVLVARYFEGRTTAEVAAELGVSRQRANQLEWKAFAAFERQLAWRRRAVCA